MMKARAPSPWAYRAAVASISPTGGPFVPESRFSDSKKRRIKPFPLRTHVGQFNIAPASLTFPFKKRLAMTSINLKGDQWPTWRLWRAIRTGGFIAVFVGVLGRD